MHPLEEGQTLSDLGDEYGRLLTMSSGDCRRVHELSEANHQILSDLEYMDEVALEGLAGGPDCPSVVTNRNHLVALTNVLLWVELKGFLCFTNHPEEIRYLISALAMTSERNTLNGR